MNVLKRFLLSFMLVLTCTLAAYAQTEITGTVVDETGETNDNAHINWSKMEVAAQNGMTVTLKDNAVELTTLVVTG